MTIDRPFGSYRALSFDCYGTLIDWETGLVQALQPYLAWRDVELGTEQVLALFGRHEHVVQTEHPAMRYPEVLAESLCRLGAEIGRPPRRVPFALRVQRVKGPTPSRRVRTSNWEAMRLVSSRR